MDPSHRLDRRTAGQWLHEPKALEGRLFSRLVELRQPRTILRDLPQGRGFKVRKIRRVADPHPNAPQLIRLIRNPFKLHGSRPRRVEGRATVPWSDLRRQPTELASAVAESERELSFQGNPLRAYDTRLGSRPRPSAQAWLDSRGR